ncbi:MAG: hypothetical protein G8345_09855 [Magnetococcales bacterium]|nr:hypothetical protein [Magnetococcales bacterium]NGZ27174.1 hypothetical protein [Magnetococcales bacterium]
MEPSTDKQEALRRQLACYGADPRRWPDRVEGHAPQEWVAQENSLDEALSALALEEVPSDLRKRVLAIGQQRRESGFWWWPFGPLWQPVAALALSAMLGLGMGSMWAPPVSEDPAWQEVVELMQGLPGELENEP